MTALTTTAARRWRSPAALLDRVTGRVTMYRVVLVALLTLLVVALVEAAAGLIAYDPVAILVNGAAVTVATYGSNRLVARIWGVRPHSESSFVTALILLFLFQPSLTVLSVGAVALAGVVASLSKYVLAVRGRHVVNPAAFAAVVLSIAIPTAFPGWWVGAPTLLPVVVLAAVVILARTGRLLMGALFVVVATVGIVLSGLAYGSTFPDALSTAVLSSPIVFFAGFMLSEPLTLPPRRWQQLVLAVVVGVLFAVPFHVGPVIGTYELALVIGNVLAFAVGQRRGVRLHFAERRQIAPESWEFTFRPRNPLSFRAGQWVELSVPHRGADNRGQRRVFSVVSAPADTGTVRIGIRLPERSSSLKAALRALGPGDVVTGTVVGGDFVLPRDPSVPLLLVAGGIGITPFVSHLRDLAARQPARAVAETAHPRADAVRAEAAGSTDAVLVYAVSSAVDAAYLAEIPLGGARRGVLVCPDPPEHLPAGWTAAGAGPVTAELLQRVVPDLRERRAYVAGSPRLVSGTRTALRRLGVRHVVTDAFTGY